MKKQKIKQLIQGVLLGLASAAGGYYIGRRVTAWIPEVSGVEAVLAIGLAMVGIWVALAVHELAHLLTGLAQGFRFDLYVAGFLGARRQAETGRVEFFWNTDMKLFGGIAGASPVAEYPDITRRFARMVIAGPLGSLALALVAGSLSWLLSAGGALPLAGYFLWATALASGGLFLATTIPGRTGMYFTDRARFFRLLGGGETAAVERTLLETVAYTQSDRPLADLDTARLERLQNDSHYAFIGNFYGYFQALARRDFPQAIRFAHQFSELPEGMPVTFQAEVWKELCFAHAFLLDDVSAARSFYEKAKKRSSLSKDASALRAQAALARAEGRTGEARELAGKGLALLHRKASLTSLELVEQELLDTLTQVAVDAEQADVA